MAPSGSPMRRVAPPLALAAVLALAQPAAAFDTGHHFDLTAAALAEQGFGRPAVRQAQIANWVTDYLNTPVYPDQTLARRFDLLHFDDLPNDAAVRARWMGTVANTRRVVEAAAAQGDAEGVLTALGMTLHAVQDFYSHSNWTEAHPREPGGAYRTETFFSDPMPGMLLRTSMHPDRAATPEQAHGDYFRGMNKDSHVRRGWSEAYVFAHAGSREWVGAVRGWAEAVRPGIWAACSAWRPDAEAERDSRRQIVVARRLSSFGSFGALSNFAFVRQVVPTGVDGHWKGNGSGSFVGTLLAAIGGPSPRSSAVATRAIALAPPLVEGLARWNTPPRVMAMIAANGGGGGISGISLEGRAVVVRTLAVRALTAGIDPVGAPDLYSRVAVGGQTFIEAPQRDRDASTPAWAALALVPPGTRRVPIAYALFDEDYPDTDDPVALTAAGPLRFWYEPATGRVGGLPADARVEPSRVDEGVIVTVRGRDAEVRLRLTSARLAPAHGRFESREAGI